MKLPNPPVFFQKIFDKYQDQLSQSQRWNRFKINETPQEWAELLGPDVVCLTHPHVTVQITQDFIDYNQQNGLKLSKNQQEDLLTVAWEHDLGELILKDIGVGDIMFDLKTKDDELVEYEVFKIVIKDEPDENRRKYLEKLYIDNVMNEEDGLAEMFNAIERVGFLTTAIRAFNGANGQRITNGLGMSGNTLSNQIVKLVEYADKYPYVKQFLTTQAKTITQMFKATKITPIPLCPDHNPAWDQTKLNQAQIAWSKFHYIPVK